MYTGAMETSRLIGVYPLGWGAGRAVISLRCLFPAIYYCGREVRTICEERSVKTEELYELEILGRKLRVISGPMVGRQPDK